MAKTIDMTVRVVEALTPPASGRDEYKDSKTAGLYLRVTANGVKTFSFVGRPKGASKPERATIGKYPGVKPEEARRRAVVMAGEMAEGVSVGAAARGRRKELTLQEAFTLYTQSLTARRAKRGWPPSLWDLHVKPFFALRRLSEITAKDLERWHASIPARILKRREEERQQREAEEAARRARIAEAQAIRRRGPDPKPKAPSLSTNTVSGHRTANQALELVRTVYSWASKPQQGYFTGVNPATGHKMFPTNERERFLRPDELAPFFEALAQEPNTTFRDAILIALLTGARRANVTAMEWRHVDLERAEWRIPGEVQKNGQPQTVPLVPEALELLKLRKEASKSKFVFPSDRSEEGHIKDPRKAWSRLLRQSGLTDLRLHDLRRTLGSWQARTGASLVLIGKSLNHKDQASTAIYARLDLDPVRQSLELAATAMFNAASQQDAKVIPLPVKSTGKPAAKSA